MAEDKTKLTAHDLATAIRARYEPPEWHIEEEVTLSGRRLDVVAFNMWATRGFRVVGFEIKVSRGDWLRELSAFQKSEEWTSVVDAFYVVAPPKLVRDDELPAGWGLLELTGSRMMTRRHAEQRPAGLTLPREVCARFLGRMAQRDRAAEQEAEWRARSEIRKEIEARVRTELTSTSELDRQEAERVRREYHALLKALGVEPGRWHAHEEAMKAAGIFARAASDTSVLRRELERNAQAMEGHARRLREAHDALVEQTNPAPSVAA